MIVTRRHPSPWNVTMTRSALVLAIALAACGARPATAPVPVQPDGTTVALPAIPDSVPSALGMVPVVVMDSLKNMRGQALMGGMVPETRTIYLARSISNRAAQWQTLEHEKCHLNVFWDTGIRNAFNTPGGDALQDSICDAVATARVREMQQQQRAK